jgi:hypothetical protein
MSREHGLIEKERKTAIQRLRFPCLLLSTTPFSSIPTHLQALRHRGLASRGSRWRWKRSDCAAGRWDSMASSAAELKATATATAAAEEAWSESSRVPPLLLRCSHSAQRQLTTTTTTKRPSSTSAWTSSMDLLRERYIYFSSLFSTRRRERETSKASEREKNATQDFEREKIKPEK